MVRRLLTPRWLAIHLLALALVVACLGLGRWQLHRADAFEASTRSEPAAVPLATLTRPAGALPGASIGRLVLVSGSYDAAHSYLVPGRKQGGRSGFWLLSVLRVPGGAGVIVLRGWAPSVPAAAGWPPPGGPVEVTGRLMAAEDPGGGLPPGTTLPAGQVAAASPVALLSLVPYQLYDGYVVLRGQAPPAPAGLALVPSPQTANSVPGFYFQHVAYVALWVLFALFVVFFWSRLVLDARRPGSDGSAAAD